MHVPTKCTMLSLLLAGLLVAGIESYPRQATLQIPVQQQDLSAVVKGWPEISQESLQDNTNEDPDFVPDYDNEDYYEYSEENQSGSQDGLGSFIASEETEEGELWASDDDPDWTPSPSQEEGSYEEDDDYFNSQEENDSYQDVSDQENQGPFPQPGVIAEYGQQQGTSGEGKDSYQEVHQESLPVKGKRNVKRSYQVSQQVVQEPQQAVKVLAPYGSEQGKVDSGLWGTIQEEPGEYPGVAVGVEPIFPVGGPQQEEVGAGVEPVVQKEVNVEKEKESGGSSIGGWFREGWNKFTGAVEDLGEKAEDTFRALGDKVEHAAGEVHETISGVVDKLHQTYEDVRQKLPQVLNKFKVLILKFGAVIQEGALYCVQRFDKAFDQVRELQVIEKLEKELEKGHAEVAKFFQILGEKVQAWRAEHGSVHVDAGLIDGYKPVSGQTQLEEGPHRQDFENMPNFFQDNQVIVQLNKLNDIGILTEDDIIILTEQHGTQHQHQDQHQHQNQDFNSQQTQNQNNDFLQQQNQQQNHYNQQQQQRQNTGTYIQFPQ